MKNKCYIVYVHNIVSQDFRSRLNVKLISFENIICIMEVINSNCWPVEENNAAVGNGDVRMYESEGEKKWENDV